MAVTGTITTRFIDENGVDLGKQLIEKDYLISLYPNLFPQYKTSGLYLWGGNSSGQLGDNTVSNKSSPVQTITYGYTWEQVAYGSSHAVGLKNDGTLWTWGSNAYGQLGDGTFSAKSSPVQVVGNATNWQQVSAGYQHSAGIKTDGTLWTWGLNNYGQLGDNTVGNEAIPVPSEIGDQFFNYNTLVLTGDGTNNGTNNTFLDSSGNNLSITRNGNVTQGTFTPYSMPDGYWSNFFDGSGDYLSATTTSALNFGTGDFTVECWVNLSSIATSQAILVGNANSSFFFRYGTGFNVAGGLNIARTSVADYEYCTFTFKVGTWYHIAVVRQSNVIKFFINGIQQTTQGSGAANFNYGNETTTYIGRSESNAELFNGYISNLRVVKSAIYTANFNPQQTPLSVASNTSILTCQSNRFIDKSLNNFNITATGDTVVSTTSPFIYHTTYNSLIHSGSGYFDGSGDYLTITNVPLLNMQLNDFTIEFYMYMVARAGGSSYSDVIIYKGNNNIVVFIEATTNTFRVGNYGVSTDLISSTTIRSGTWYHIAITRSGSSYRLFINGILESSASNTANFNSNDNLIIAQDTANTNQKFYGFISSLRIIRGTALYTANFTPPTAPLQRVPNTALLLNFTNGQIVDAIRKNDLETVGDAKVSTAVTKYGSSSMYFDGNGDYLTSRLNDTYAFSTGDFTIEMWINPSTTNHQSACLITQEHIAAQNSPISISIFLNNGSFETVGNQLGFGQYNGTLGSTWTIQQHGIATLSVGVWTHIALVRYGNNFTMFVNGVALRTTTSSVSCSIGNTQYFIARRWDISGSYPYFNGYIDDLRITKGVARYTGNFTPPRSLLLPVAGSSLLTCQNRRFVDNSINASVITTAGDVSVQPWSPFAQTYLYDATTYGGSGFFDGTGDNLTLANNTNLDLTTGDFTVETWFYARGIGNDTAIITRNNGNAGSRNDLQYWIGFSGGSLYISPYQSTATYQIIFSGISINQWYHIAFVRTGNTFYGYLNGVRSGTTLTISGALNTGTWLTYVGSYTGGSTTYFFNGYLSGLRIVKGTALYTGATFTLPSTPSTAVTNTQLLLNFTNGAIVDSTGRNNIETVGDAKISTSIKKFGSGSIAFDGTGDALVLPNTNLFNFGTGDFTIECWIYIAANSAPDAGGNREAGLVTSAPASGTITGFEFRIRGNTTTTGIGLLFRNWVSGTNYDISATSSISQSTWHHVAVSRSGTTTKLFLNGSEIASGTLGNQTVTNSIHTTRIGSLGYLSYPHDFNGYIDDIRISRFARYTSNFTPPTAAFGVDQYFNLTSLLISADGPNNGQNNTFIDSSTNNFTITRNGNVTQGSFTPFSLPEGNWSNYFDGSGDYLSVPDSSNWVFDTDWTVEAWVYMTASPTNSYNIIIGQQADGIGTGWSMGVDGNGLYFYAEPNNGSWSLSGGAIPLNTWTHIAASGASNVGRLFINGVLRAYSSYTGTFKDIAYPLVIGTTSNNTNRYYAGYVSNARVIKGRALYTANFTPTQNFTGTGSTTWRNVSCGKYFTAATKTDGSVWTWGYNSNGQLGDYSIIHRSSAVQVLSTGNTWQQVATGYHTAGVKTDGTLWVWGKNNLGQLGDNTIVHKSFPSQMTTGDPFYNRNVLLINANGTNNGQNNTFIDSSSNNFTITRNGNATQGSFTPNSVPEGYWSNFFSTAHSHLSCGTNSNLALGAGDFTVEFWLYCYSYNPNYQCLIDWRTNGGIPANVPAIFMLPTGQPYIAIANSAGTAFVDIVSNTVLPLHTWNHLAYVRSGTNITIYMNGVVVASAVNSTNLAIQTLSINDPQPAADLLTTGYFSNVRIVKGFAVYTQSFTPPTVPLTAIPGTVLLTCQGNRFRDISSVGNTITPNNTPSVAPFSPFVEPTEYTTTLNGGSGYFGNGNYLTCSYTAFNNVSGDFTIECWAYVEDAGRSADSSKYGALLSGGAVGSNSDAWGYYILISGGVISEIHLLVNNAFVVSSTGRSIALNAWHHFAMVRSGSTVTLYVNGTSVGSATYTATIPSGSTGRTLIGQGSFGGSYANFVKGYISSVRIMVGTALYTSSFTPSTTPPSLLPNTNLLLNFTNAQIFDAIGMNDIETVNNAQVSTSIVKYGTGSMSFVRSPSSYLVAPNNRGLFTFGTGDWTIEAWIYMNTMPAGNGYDASYWIVGGGPQSNNTGFDIAIGSTNLQVGLASFASLNINFAHGMSAQTWYHVAIVRSGSTLYAFKDGTQLTSVSVSGVTVDPCLTGLAISAAEPVGATAGNFNGYIDDLRISRYARYTSNFTPGPITTLAVPATNWKSVSCGYNFTAATKTDGTLWTWGGNTLGQLGDTTTTHRSSPVQTISSNNTWRQASCGLNHMSALKTDGTLWSWGGNSYGNLGDNTTTHRSSPVQTIIQGITWKQISAGDRGTAAILDANY